MFRLKEILKEEQSITRYKKEQDLLIKHDTYGRTTQDDQDIPTTKLQLHPSEEDTQTNKRRSKDNTRDDV